MKRTAKMSRPLSKNKILEMDVPTFRAYLRNEELSFKTMQGYARELYAQEQEADRKKYKLLAAKMKKEVQGGYVSKRRVPGTGKRVEQEREYKDTPTNRRLGRVGTKYKYVYYEDAETKEITPKVKRAKRKKTEKDEKRVHLWINSVKKAKAEMREEGQDIPGWVVIRKEPKEKDSPTEEEKLGIAIYKRAMKIMDEEKKRQSEEK